MEKISNIVPRSRRVASADLASAPAVRPGAPTYGRPVGSSTVGAKEVLTTAQRAIAEQQKMLEHRKTSALTPELVEDMTNRFFLQRMTTAEPPATGIAPDLPEIVAPAPKGGAPINAEEPGEAITMIESSGVPEEDEYVPVGTLLNVEA